MIVLNFGLSTGGYRRLIYKLYNESLIYLGDCDGHKKPNLQEIAEIKGKSYREYISDNGKPKFSCFE